MIRIIDPISQKHNIFFTDKSSVVIGSIVEFNPNNLSFKFKGKYLDNSETNGKPFSSNIACSKSSSPSDEDKELFKQIVSHYDTEEIIITIFPIQSYVCFQDNNSTKHCLLDYTIPSSEKDAKRII